MALMVGAMTIHGIVPGPQVMTKQPELFWGLIASMWIGNLMLVVINLPLVGLWVRLLRVPYRMLFPAILIFCAIGVYSINNAPADVIMVAAFGLVGYWLVKHDFEPAPMLLGFVLGPLMEENLRRAMLIARGDPTTFLTRPISGVLLALAAFLLVLALLPMIRRSATRCSSKAKHSSRDTRPQQRTGRADARARSCWRASRVRHAHASNGEMRRGQALMEASMRIARRLPVSS